MSNYYQISEGEAYDVLTTRGALEVQVAKNVVILACDYKDARWHERCSRLKVGEVLDGGEILEVRRR